MGWATAAVGAACAVVGTGLGIRLVADWAAGGFGDFTRTQEAEIVSFLVIFGVQLLLSVGFLAIFAEGLRRRSE